MKSLHARLCLLFITVALFSCSPLDENIDEQVFDPSSDQLFSRNDSEDDSISHRGIYVNNFENDILGTIEELNLLHWCNQNSFNEVTLYNISSILDDQYKTFLLTNFVAKAHAFNIRVSFVASSEEAINKIEDYQNLVGSSFLQSDGLATEYEFWNSNAANVSYDYYHKNMLKPLKRLDDDSDYDWKQQLYISEFEDAAGQYTNDKVLKKVLQHLKKGDGNDQIFLVNYRTNAQNFPTDSNSNHYQRIQRIAKVAKKKKIQVNIVVLFMTREDTSPSLFNYFSDLGEGNDFQDAFINYRNGFYNSDIKHKDYINLEGYQVYRYSDAKIAKPLLQHYQEEYDIVEDDDEDEEDDDNDDDEDDDEDDD